MHFDPQKMTRWIEIGRECRPPLSTTINREVMRKVMKQYVADMLRAEERYQRAIATHQGWVYSYLFLVYRFWEP